MEDLTLTKREWEVLGALESFNGEATTGQIRDKLGTTMIGTGQILSRLLGKKMVAYLGQDRGNDLWMLTWILDPEILTKWSKRVLEYPFWIQGLGHEQYSRLQDDHDGTGRGRIQVSFDQMGDAWFSTDLSPRGLRFRTHGGGGMSLRVRAALMILAYAIKLDNEDRPQE